MNARVLMLVGCIVMGAICVSTWIVSYWWSFGIDVGSDGHSRRVTTWSNDGWTIRFANPRDIELTTVYVEDGALIGRSGFDYSLDDRVTWARFGCCGFEYGHWFATPGTVLARRVEVPIWALACVLLSYPAYVALRAIGLRTRHRCAHCDYDLMGNVSGVCPECGAAI